MAIAQDFNQEFNCEFDTDCSKRDPSVFHSIVAFPNPCEDEFYIKYKDNDGILRAIKEQISVCLIDVAGRILIKTSDSKIDVSTLSNGFYTAVVEANSQKFYIKLIKI